MLTLTLTSGCGLYHFVFYPPSDCACSTENLLVTQQMQDHDPEDESDVVYESEHSLDLDNEDGHAVADKDHDHAETDDEHGHDEEEEGDENEAVAEIAPADLKSLGIEETNEGTNARSRTPSIATPAELHEQAARLERALQVTDVVDASARVDLTSKTQKLAAEQKHSVSLPSDSKSTVITGDFLGEQDNLAIITPGNSIKIYASGRLAAQRPLTGQDAPADLSELTKEIVQPVSLIQNSTLQILIHSAETQTDGAILYKARIYRVFGNEIGIIFDETIARRDAKDQPLRRLGQLEFLHGMNHRFIRWTPLDKNQKPAAEPSILRWNRWEGVYRIPTPPPTAPKNQS